MLRNFRRSFFAAFRARKPAAPITGLSRLPLVELIDAGKIRAVRLRKKGAARGVTLINRQSLLDYLQQP